MCLVCKTPGQARPGALVRGIGARRTCQVSVRGPSTQLPHPVGPSARSRTSAHQAPAKIGGSVFYVFDVLGGIPCIECFCASSRRVQTFKEMLKSPPPPPPPPPPPHGVDTIRRLLCMKVLYLQAAFPVHSFPCPLFRQCQYVLEPGTCSRHSRNRLAQNLLLLLLTIELTVPTYAVVVKTCKTQKRKHETRKEKSEKVKGSLKTNVFTFWAVAVGRLHHPSLSSEHAPASLWCLV